MNVKVPSDIDMADRILWGLTARQLAILAVTSLAGWALYLSLYPVAPPAAVLFGILAAGAGLALAFTRPDGLAAERWLAVGLRHLLSPRRRVLAPEDLPSVPVWARSKERLQALDPLVQSFAESGVLTLDRGYSTLVCRASALNLSLRSESERAALVQGLGRFLNALDAPVAFVIRSERADLSSQIRELETRAPALPHPALERAASSHAQFLSSLAERKDILRREIYVVFTQHGDEDSISSRLLGRSQEAAALLRGIGIRLSVLDGTEAVDLVARSFDSESRHLATRSLPGDVVTGGGA